MGFFKKWQVNQLDKLNAKIDELKKRRNILVYKYSGDNKHSQACEYGGMFAAGNCTISGVDPCPCVAEVPEG